MKYAWGDWSLDREAGLLKRGGRPVAVSRRVLDCIAHLIAHRDRVVGHDELVACIWGHQDISHHQLHQVIQAARRRLGDDGKSQRLIRTIGRYGYQWTGTLDDAAVADAPAFRPPAIDTMMPPADPSYVGRTDSAPTPTTLRMATAQDMPGAVAEPHPPQAEAPSSAESSPDTAYIAGTPTAGTRRRSTAPLTLPLLLAVLLGAFAYSRLAGTPSSTPVPPELVRAAHDSLDTLEAAMYAGDFDTVREGLATLPPSKAESPDAMLIAMRLDLHRGRFERAWNTLEAQQRLAEAADDPIWRAKLLVFRAQLQGRQQAPAAEQLASAQAAIDLLTALGEDAAPTVLARALERRSAGMLLLGRHEEALRDLARSGDLHASLGDTRSVTWVRTQRARVWMRTGRLEEALKETQSTIDDYERQSNRIGAVTAYIAMTRIQMELLRWQDALASNDRALEVFRANPFTERRGHVLELRALALAQLGRLREARATLEEAQILSADRSSSPFAVPYLLAAGKTQAALDASALAFARAPTDDLEDIVLDHREGTLLLWTVAAQRIAAQGLRLPIPSQAQVDTLRAPRSIAGTIASGRWAMMQGDLTRAESQLRFALEQARGKGMRYHMVLATEPLFDLLQRQQRTADAEELIRDVRAYDRERFDGDFHFMQLRWRSTVALNDGRAAQTLLVKLDPLAGERGPPSRSPCIGC